MPVRNGKTTFCKHLHQVPSSPTFKTGTHLPAFPLATDNNLPTFPWSRDARKALTQIFHLKDFRQNQLEAINSTLSGKDCFVLMPTGGGKSLCYQLPACLGSGATSGVTLVISPLLSLIQDQVSKLIGLGITALAICGTHSTEYRQWAYQELESIPPKVKLVYVTPEMVMKSPRFQGLMSDLHRRKALARFVIDEAHCVSQWGHDFRPDYKQLGTLKRDFPGVPILALTATANDKVKADIIYTLDITKCDKYVQSFNRPNLRYEVRKKGTSIVEDMVALIRTHYPSQCGIIYCGSRRACEEVTKKLEQKRLPVAFYHAGLHKDDRQRVQKNWATGSTRIIIATVAFGMGIDKGNVRFVIHYSLPQSIEGYYQETGRAGRDGKESLCILYYAYRDKHIIDMLITKGEGSQEQKDRQKGNLRDMIAFCENDRDCRRQQVLQYFGERFDAQKCNRTCDNCRRVQQNTVVKDVRSDAQAIIAMVTHLQSNSVTMTHCIDIYRGANLKKILALKHNELPWFGKGNTFIRTDIERLFHFLAGKEILTEIVTKNGQGFPYAHVRVSSV
ncbi:P-loop containing nucleoside triphosphate hydrolase protein [Phlyctochytrium arcticum]|nr:P-loop containing nucleoside triphosphate hydrolase protein [Phlyctochytrium arcticum]